MFRVVSLATVGALFMVAGCAAPGVVRGSTTTPSLRSLAVTSLVLNSLGRPPETIGTGTTPQIAMLAIESGTRRLDHAERDLLTLYERSGAAEGVFAAADLGPAGAPNPAFLVSYRLLSYQEHFDGFEGRYWAGYVLGCITAGLGFLIAIDSHADWTHSFEFEVRVYDVRGASMVRVQQADGILQNVYDTSIAAPLLRRTYSGQMRTYIGAGTGGPGGADLERFMDEQGTELAQTMFDLSAEDVMRAARRAAAQPVPAAPAQPAISATSGGETVVAPTAAQPTPEPPAPPGIAETSAGETVVVPSAAPAAQ